MIGKGAQYLTAAGFGRYRITAASLGRSWILDLGWLKWQTRQAIMDAFGVDGPAVIAATNEYLNGIAASDKAKATALASYINEDPMMVCSLPMSEYLPSGFVMPVRYIKTTDVNQFYLTGVSKASGQTLREEAIVKYDKTGVRRLQGLSGSGSEYWGVTASNTYEKVTASQSNIAKMTSISYSYGQNNTELKFFAISDSGSWSNAGCYRSESKVYLAGVLVRDYIPFKRNGKMEFLNMLDLTLATRVGEPSEYYELPDGTPWTPPAP